MCFISGCTSTPPTYHYKLSPIKAQKQRSTELSLILVGVGPIQIPGYLERAQVITQVNSHLVYLHEFHQWVETLQKQLEDTIAYNLSALIHPQVIVTYPWERSTRPKYQLIIDFRKFGGSLDQVELEALWQVLDTRSETVKLSRLFTTQVLVSQPNINAHVSALSRALRRFSREVARELKALE